MKIERTLSLDLTLHYDLDLPASDDSPLLIAVHGYGAHKGYMMREAKSIAPQGFAIASIEGPYRFWRETKEGKYKPAFGWSTDYRPEESIAIHHEFLSKIIEELISERKIDATKIFLFGFSQACALNFRFAFSNPALLKGIIGISGGIPSDLASNPLYSPIDAAGLYLYGDDDEFYSLETFRSNEDKICEFIPALTAVKYSAKHVITDEMRKEMRAWIKENV